MLSTVRDILMYFTKNGTLPFPSSSISLAGYKRSFLRGWNIIQRCVINQSQSFLMMWMDAKKEKTVFKGGHVIATQVNGCWVGARKGNETKESRHLKIISFCIRRWLILPQWVELKNHPHLILTKDKILLVMNTSSLNDICQVRKHTCDPVLK